MVPPHVCVDIVITIPNLNLAIVPQVLSRCVLNLHHKSYALSHVVGLPVIKGALKVDSEGGAWRGGCGEGGARGWARMGDEACGKREGGCLSTYKVTSWGVESAGS